MRQDSAMPSCRKKELVYASCEVTAEAFGGNPAAGELDTLVRPDPESSSESIDVKPN